MSAVVSLAAARSHADSSGSASSAQRAARTRSVARSMSVHPAGSAVPARAAGVSATSPAAPAAAHPGWCVQHSSHGCLGAPFTLPGTDLRVWLAAPTPGDARLVVDSPGGYVEMPVVA